MDIISTAADIQATIDRLDELLSPEFDDTWSSYELAARSATAPRSPHRLARVRFEVKRTIQALRNGAPMESVPVEALHELRAVVAVLSRWEHTPHWPYLRRTLTSANQYPHDVGVLGLVHYLGTEGLAAEVNMNNGPDVFVASRRGVITPTEVKAPADLQQPRARFSPADAVKRIDRALKKAGTGEGGQLSPERPGALVIAALALTERDLPTLLAGAQQSWKRWQNLRPHICAIGFCILAIRQGSAVWAASGNESQPMTSYSSSFVVRFAGNPAFDGQTFLDDVPQLGWLPVRR